LGAPLALVSFGGLLWAMWRMFRRRPAPGEAVLLAWALPFFIVTGSFQVKFLRYLLPLTPFLAVYGAGMLMRIRGIGELGNWGIGRVLCVLGQVTLVGTLLFSALWAAAFVWLYRVDEHPWIATSRWIYQNVPEGSVIATEHWDHALPLSLRDENGRLFPNRFREVELEWFDVEDRRGAENKRVELGAALRQAAGSDYLILASNRLYGVIPRLPERYPEAAAYYRLLFSGDLGFELVHLDGRYPGGVIMDDTLAWPDLPEPHLLSAWRRGKLNLGPADESLTVYDHPLALVFENRGRLSAAELERLIRVEAAVGATEGVGSRMSGQYGLLSASSRPLGVGR